MADHAGSDRQPGVRWDVTLGWAIYLAVSWTWCIGMFLPLLLLRDFGPAGYIAFAVPNVIGAAAMGWTLVSPEASRRFVERHRTACAWFGVVTVLFHVAFVLEVLYPLEAPRAGVLGGLGVLLGAILLAAVDRPRLVAVLTYVVSLGSIAFLASRFGLPLGALDPEAAARADGLRLGQADVLLLIPACAFGFLLCPYLDLTFHRARQHLEGQESRLGFGLGFGLFFLAMIMFTICYASVFEPAYKPLGVKPPRAMLGALVLHLAAQAAATVAFHLRSLAMLRPQGTGKVWSWGLGIVLIAAAGCMLPRAGAPVPPSLADPEERLVWYRVFMSFYGLVFPGYVWLVAIPTGEGHAGTRGPEGRRKLVALGCMVALAAPCFWLGFIERQTWWLGPGMAIALGSRFFVRPREKRRAT